VIGAEIVSSRASLDVPDHQFLFVSLPAAVQRRQASRKQTITEAAGGPQSTRRTEPSRKNVRASNGLSTLMYVGFDMPCQSRIVKPCAARRSSRLLRIETRNLAGNEK
jgi:hypothetical protein